MLNHQPTSKPHYPVLDGLRGVAAVMVVIFHIFEAHGPNKYEQLVNHGYLAVDFFFLLSGFVVGYAYDDRWNTLTIGSFFKRRMIRLQPMVVMGMLVGAILFYFGTSSIFPNIATTPVWKMLFVMFVGFTLIPVPTSMDIRGWTEMHPLDGPAWSLFFEYIANILYAIIVRKFSTLLLGILVLVSAIALIHYTVAGSNGDVIGGWSLDIPQLKIGFTRLMFPFFGGLLLSRMVRLIQVNHAFLLCSLLVIVSLSLPRFGGTTQLWKNGLYDSLVIIIVFPLIVYLGASGATSGKWIKKLCTFFGNISYPIYITHYPLIYLYTAWVIDNKVPLDKAYPVALLLLISSIGLAYACLKWYDEPARKWLREKLLR